MDNLLLEDGAKMRLVALSVVALVVVAAGLMFGLMLASGGVAHGQASAVTKVYWTDRDNATLSVTDVSSGQTQVLVANTGGRLQDVDLDTTTGILYFADWGPLGLPANQGSINQVNTDGTGLATVFNTNDAVHQLALDEANQLIYFTRAASYADHEISVVDYVGGNYTVFLSGDFAGPGWFPSGLALDSVNNLLYWGDIGVIFNPPNGSVNRMTITGAAQTQLTPHVTGRGRGFALDQASQTIFFTSHNPLSPGSGGGLFSYDIVNDIETQLIDDPTTGYWDIEIDPVGQRIWYTDYGRGQIRSAKFDGTDVQIELSGLTNPYGLALELEIVPPGGIGEIKPGTPFTPDPTGNGRAVAFDGLTTLYYTITGTPNIYKVSTLGFGSLGPIPLAGRSFLCGSLSWDSGLGELWCGSYDGSSDVYTVNPGTGVATLQFNANAVIPGGIAQDSCYGAGVEDFIDGLALDSNGSVWLSGDAARTIYHIDPSTPALLGSFTVPDHPNSGVTGCNTGIEVAPGGFLELAMQTGPDQGPHDIVKIVKRDDVNNPPIIVSFTALGTNDPGIEDIAYDAKTFAPRCALWSNEFGASNVLTAWDVQCTRTIGYWKNHADDAVQFLPISLGDGVCEDVTTAAQVETIMKAHKGQDAGPKLYAQLLAAKLNVAMGDLPPADFAAIAPVIDAADALLGKSGCNPDTGKKGADRAEAQTLLGQLDTFNNKYSP